MYALLPFVWLLPTLVLAVTIPLTCSQAPLPINVNDSYTVKFGDDGINCVHQLVPASYVGVHLSISSNLYDGDYINITRNATSYSPAFNFSTADRLNNAGNYVFDLPPVPFTLSVHVTGNTSDEVLHIALRGVDWRPVNPTIVTVSSPMTTTFIDSEDFPIGNRSGVVVQSPGVGKPTTLRAVNYPQLKWEDSRAAVVYIFDGDDYICTLLDLLSLASSGFIPSNDGKIVIVDRGSDTRAGVTYLAAPAIEFPGSVYIRALSESDGPVLVDAHVTPAVVYYVAPRGTYSTRYSTHFTFVGGGNLSYYAGALPGPRDELLLATVTEDDAEDSVPLQVKGRGRTLTLDVGKIIIDSSTAYQASFEIVNAGERGVFMSSNYPYASVQDEFDTIQLKGKDESEQFQFNVEVFAGGLARGDFLGIDVRDANVTQFFNFTSAAEVNISAVGNLAIFRYLLSPESTGVLARYTVLDPPRHNGASMTRYGCHMIIMVFYCMYHMN